MLFQVTFVSTLCQQPMPPMHMDCSQCLWVARYNPIHIVSIPCVPQTLPNTIPLRKGADAVFVGWPNTSSGQMCKHFPIKFELLIEVATYFKQHPPLFQNRTPEAMRVASNSRDVEHQKNELLQGCSQVYKSKCTKGLRDEREIIVNNSTTTSQAGNYRPTKTEVHVSLLHTTGLKRYPQDRVQTEGFGEDFLAGGHATCMKLMVNHSFVHGSVSDISQQRSTNIQRVRHHALTSACCSESPMMARQCRGSPNGT
jgi:hypothetical protein